MAYAFNVDLEKTNLLRAPDWPILISNLVELRGRTGGPERWNYRAGEWVRIRLGAIQRLRCTIAAEQSARDLPSARLMEFTAPAPCGLMEVLEGTDVLFQLGVKLPGRSGNRP
jgi:hypothetical protein